MYLSRLTCSQHRLNWTIDLKTGRYHSQFPTPTGNPADPILTSHGVRQSHELAAHLVSDGFEPKPWRVYCSPFYRCLQTIRPAVEALKKRKKEKKGKGECGDDGVDLDVRVERGLGEWFGPTTFFDHPSPSPPSTLRSHFPTILHPAPESHYTPHLIPSTRGETIAQLHDRVATTLQAIIADVDAEIDAFEASLPPGSPERTSSKAILICSHAAPLIAMGRALTGNMPEDSGVEDFKVFTAGLSTFVRRGRPTRSSSSSCISDRIPAGEGDKSGRLAPGTKIVRPDTSVPDWRGGKGVGGGWDCVVNGDCSFLSGGAERGWHFNGEESFDTGPMAPPTATPKSSEESSIGTKL
ncbi:hypothetical protein VTN00DRAFT_9246 [Thermoascus crustaceus]|uniref:uncharacterized protein n=1 Tax=Thermoascus crustaceus TaxID=5088 RepID=UPI003742B526